MLTREALVARLDAGEAPKFLFFWGHTPKHEGVVDASCLSQWFGAPFTEQGVRYATAEHWMMAAKARLFGDAAALTRIVAAPTPADAKALGRAVKGYDDAAWGAARAAAVVRGNVLKFAAHPELLAFLQSTAPKVLVEAAPRDVVWGIGLGASNPSAREPRKWRGRNLLGFALMAARDELA